MRNQLKRLSAWGIAVLLMAAPLVPALAAEAASDTRTIHITSASEFKAFAKDCATNTYSQGLTVILEQDIDLSGYGSVSVPVFCGTFDGNHHTITGYDSRGRGSDRGLFRYIKSGAVVHSLTVSGTVEPEGTKSGLGILAGRNEGLIRSCAVKGTVTGDESIGGVVGVNEASGVVLDCLSQVVVTGSTNAGGIAGRSEGTIQGCINEGAVNTDGNQSPTNTGGITGKSNGVIRSCTNKGEIGYQHVGYNTGGIVGIQDGSVISCVNHGKVYGRKDVGGIVGQFEPYIDKTYGTKPIDELDRALDSLSGLLNQLADQVSNAADNVVDDFKVMNDAMSSIRHTAHSAGVEAIDDADAMLGDIHVSAQSINLSLDGLINDSDAFIQETSKNLEQVIKNMKKVRKNLIDIPYTLTNGVSTAIDEVDSATSTAHGRIQDALAELQGAKDDLNRLNRFVNQVVGILTGGGSDTDKLGQLSEALQQLGTIDPSARLARVKKALADATDAMKLMVSNVQWGISQSADEIQQSLRDAERALEKLENLASTINSDTAAYSSNSMNSLRQINSSMNTIQNRLRSYTSTLGDKGKETMNDVNQQLTIINDRVGQMTDGAASTNTDLHGTTKSIIAQLGKVEDAITNLVKVPEKTVDDISDEQGESGPGRVVSCKNTAVIQADANVGGIAGMVAPELKIDPEEDIDLDEDKLVVDTHTFLKATVRECRNDGAITAKNECAGGILGRAELGAAIGCINKSKVESESGSRVGGIAGESGGKIQNSASLTDLVGSDALGGIAGVGKDIINCRAMTRIDSEGEQLGAIAGSASGTVSGNYFLNEDYAGVDGINFVGQSQGVDFATFQTLSGVPADFLEFKMTFVAHGQTIAEIPVTYQGSIAENLIPEVPDADGTYGRWEDFTAEQILRSQVIHAVYDNLRSTISSSGNLPVILAEGAFSPDATVDIREWEPEEEQIPSGYRLVSAYAYRVQDDTPLPATMTLRVRAGEDGKAVAVMQDGKMQIVPSTLDGSYLVSEDRQPEGTIMVLKRDGTPIVLAGGVIATLAVLGILMRMRKKRHGRKEAQAAEQDTISAETTSAAQSEAAPVSLGEPHTSSEESEK